MPALRSNISRRRRSSLAIGSLTSIKPGTYGIGSSVSPRALTFAPNITPGTYVDPDDDDNLDSPLSGSPTIFPPTERQQSAPPRRRLPPGKRLSQGYIPRPPNAFMLFRANFVRQKHVPGSIETNHGSLSKIIGNCWRALPLDEKKYWEVEAKKAKAAHRAQYPDYRFRPVHNKSKKAAAAAAAAAAAIAPMPMMSGSAGMQRQKMPTQPADEERCEQVAQLLLEGKKGEELAEAVRQLDAARALSRPESTGSDSASTPHQHHVPLFTQRRSSSVPPPSMMYHPGGIALPSLPFLAAPAPLPAYNPAADMFAGYDLAQFSRPLSPGYALRRQSRQSRNFLGLRRASSCQPIPSQPMWETDDFMNAVEQPMPELWQLQRNWSPLPDVDTSLFEPTFLDQSGFKPTTTSYSQPPIEPHACDPHSQFASVDPHAPFTGVDTHAHQQMALSLSISPLDNFDFSSAPPTSTDSYSAPNSGMYDAIDPHMPWPPPLTESGPSSAFSGSPAQSDAALPAPVPSAQQPDQFGGGMICAPRPQHAQPQFGESWEPAQGFQVEELQQCAGAMGEGFAPAGYELYGDMGIHEAELGVVSWGTEVY